MPQTRSESFSQIVFSNYHAVLFTNISSYDIFVFKNFDLKYNKDNFFKEILRKKKTIKELFTLIYKSFYVDEPALGLLVNPVKLFSSF